MRLLRIALEHKKEIDKEVRDLIKKASSERYLGKMVLDEPDSRLKVMYYQDKPVGVCWPNRDSDGRYRTGPIFVLPEYRGKGVASDFIIEYFKDRKGRAYIEPSNTASINTFKKAGFKKVEKSSRNKNHEFDLYHKD